MKKIIVIIMLVILITLLAVFFILRNPANDVATTIPDGGITSNPIIEEKTSDLDKKVLYFYMNSFIGYLENNKWHRPEDVKLSDIFDNDYYTVYTEVLQREKSNKIKIFEETGCGSFNYDRLDNEKTEDGSWIYPSELSKLGTLNDDDGIIFELPLKLNEELANRYTKDLSDIELSSVYTIVYEDENGVKIERPNLISFNADYDLKFISETTGDISEDVKKYVDDLVVNNGLKEGTPYRISQYFKSDLNNDGVEEEVYSIASDDVYMLADSTDETYEEAYNKTEEFIKKYGSFSLVLIKSGEKINTIKDYFTSIAAVQKDINDGYGAPVGFNENYDITIVDLNEDGEYEIIIYSSGYEYEWTDLCINKDGNYILLNQIENAESSLNGDIIVASEKEITLNDTTVEDIIKDINLDISKLELGDYKYKLGKTNVFNKECDIVLAFSITNIYENDHRMYENQELIFVNDDSEILSCGLDGLLGSSSIGLGDFTTYKKYLLRVEGLSDYNKLTVYGENEKNETVITGYETKAEVKDGILNVSSYNAERRLINGMVHYSITYYKPIEENGKLSFEVDRVDLDDTYGTAEG